MTRIVKWLSLAALWVAVCGYSSPSLAVIAYQVPTGAVGNQDFGGALGMDFDVLAPIGITQLGVFDSGSNGLSTTLTAELWNRTSSSTGTLITSLEFTPGDSGTLIAGHRLKPLASELMLDVGSYTISARGYNAAEPNGNAGVPSPPPRSTDDGGGAIAFVGGGRYNFPIVPGAFPQNGDTGPANRYASGTFEFNAGPPPPPAYFEGNLVSYQVNAPQAGAQDFGGAIGMDFVANAPTLITALGAFDSNQDGLNRPITVELYARNDNGTPNDPTDDSGGAVLAAHTFFGAAETLVGGSRFRSLDLPLILAPGAYTISAWGYGAGELLANSGGAGISKQTNDGGGLLSFVGSGRFGVDTTYPPIVDGGPADRYGAGTFAFAPIPEPSTWALVVCSLGVLAVFRRRR